MVLLGVKPNLLEACCCKTEVLNGDLGFCVRDALVMDAASMPSMQPSSSLLLTLSTIALVENVNFLTVSPSNDASFT